MKGYKSIAVLKFGLIACFVIAYCYLQKISWLDLAVSGALFLGALTFLLFCQLLTFEVPAFSGMCSEHVEFIGDLYSTQTGGNEVIMFISSCFFCKKS